MMDATEWAFMVQGLYKDLVAKAASHGVEGEHKLDLGLDLEHALRMGDLAMLLSFHFRGQPAMSEYRAAALGLPRWLGERMSAVEAMMHYNREPRELYFILRSSAASDNEDTLQLRLVASGSEAAAEMRSRREQWQEALASLHCRACLRNDESALNAVHVATSIFLARLGRRFAGEGCFNMSPGVLLDAIYPSIFVFEVKNMIVPAIVEWTDSYNCLARCEYEAFELFANIERGPAACFRRATTIAGAIRATQQMLEAGAKMRIAVVEGLVDESVRMTGCRATVLLEQQVNLALTLLGACEELPFPPPAATALDPCMCERHDDGSANLTEHDRAIWQVLHTLLGLNELMIVDELGPTDRASPGHGLDPTSSSTYATLLSPKARVALVHFFRDLFANSISEIGLDLAVRCVAVELDKVPADIVYDSPVFGVRLDIVMLVLQLRTLVAAEDRVAYRHEQLEEIRTFVDRQPSLLTSVLLKRLGAALNHALAQPKLAMAFKRSFEFSALGVETAVHDAATAASQTE